MLNVAILIAVLLVDVSGYQWPQISLVQPPNGILIIGRERSTTIEFNVVGDPFPRARVWYKDGRKISSSDNINIGESGSSQTLNIISVTQDNEGTYYFTAKDEPSLEASKSPEVVLRVSYIDDEWPDSSTMQIVKAQVGAFAVLECRPPNHFGAYPKFTWSKGSQDVQESDSVYVSEYGNLVILQVAYDDYASDYRCTITIESLKEGQRTKQGPAVSLQVSGNSNSYVKPQIALKPADLNITAQEREQFRVECAVNGYPDLPTIRWYKDGVRIAASGTYYNIQNRNYIGITIPKSGGNIGGTYRCDATDTTGTSVQASAAIQIYTKPIITTGLPSAEFKKASGSQLSLACSATSTPKPQFRWYKNAQLINPATAFSTSIDGGSLIINNVNLLDRGVYQCEAYNLEGSTISTGKVKIQERLTFVIRPQDVEVYLSNAATFNCQGKGSPGPETLQWQFNGGEPPASHVTTNNIVNQATYKIPKVTSSERNGRVSCIISSPTNLYPTDTATAIVTIREGPQVMAEQKSVTSIEGNQTTLVCKVENAGSGVVWKWLFESTLINQPDDLSIEIKGNYIVLRQPSARSQGKYTCQADENGFSNHDTIDLTVLTIPRVSTNDKVRIGEGSDARLTCTVTGNPTPALHWRKGSVILTDSIKYRVETPDDYTMVLIVKNVNQAADVGVYECRGQNTINNGFKVATNTTTLTVVAACEGMDIPTSQTSEYQQSVTIPCTVNNCPQAIRTWQKDGEVIQFDGLRTIDNGDNIVLKQLLPTDGGVYSCIVDNNLGKTETYSATITVEVPTKVTEYPFSRVLFKDGDDVTLMCAAHADNSLNSLNIIWFKGNVQQQTTSTELQKDPAQSISYMKSTLVVENAIASAAGYYQCEATNGLTTDKRDTSLMLMTYPGSPGQPYNVWSGVGAVELAWREPANTGNTNLTSYQIEIEQKGNKVYRSFLSGLDPMSTSTVIYFLQGDQDYRFQIIAVNAVGKGESSVPSSSIRTIVTGVNKENLVQDFDLEAISSDSIKVTWSIPTKRTSSLRGYKIVYRNEEKKQMAKFLKVDDYTMIETILTDLDAAATYSVQIQSETQVTVNLVVSAAKTIKTLDKKPEAPIECIADRDTASRLVISWSTPEVTHGKILGYTIYYQDSTNVDGQWNSLEHEDPQTTSKAFNVPNDNADYEIRISASNSAGEGDIAECTNIGRIINKAWFDSWWFYVIIALVAVVFIGLLILLIICCYRRRSSSPKMKKVAPPHMQKNEFQRPAPQVYSPNINSMAYNPPYNQMNTFNGGASPYTSPQNTMKFGAGAGDFTFGTNPKSPTQDYNPNKFGTYDSRMSYNDPKPAFYDPPKQSYGGYSDPPKPSYSGGYDPPKSPYFDERSNYDNTSRYDNNTFDTRYRGTGGAGSQGYPPYGSGNGNFKSSQL